MTQKEENSLQELEARQKLIPFVPSATSYRMGWKALQAVRYRTMSDGVEYRLPPAPRHGLVLTIRPAEKFYLRSEGVKRDRPLYPRSILVLPAESSVWQRWQGSMDVLVIYLEPSVVARVVAETFELDPTRTVVPPLDGFNSPELFSTMSAVDAELRTGGVGDSLLAESFTTILAVHLIRHITSSHRELASADGVLPRHKLRRVTEYIMENLGGSPTLEQMAAVAQLSPYHFARQFKAATGLPPYQYVIERSSSCGQTASSGWPRSRSAPASPTKAIFAFTLSGLSASRRDSFGLPKWGQAILSPKIDAKNRLLIANTGNWANTMANY